jgi:TonB family protein
MILLTGAMALTLLGDGEAKPALPAGQELCMPLPAVYAGRKVEPADLVPPRATNRIPLPYPPAALKGGKEGTVQIEITIATDGTVLEPKVKKGVDPDLDKAALDMVKQRTYAPATLFGKPCPASMVVTVRYKLPRPGETAPAWPPPDASTRP